MPATAQIRLQFDDFTDFQLEQVARKAAKFKADVEWHGSRDDHYVVVTFTTHALNASALVDELLEAPRTPAPEPIKAP